MDHHLRTDLRHGFNPCYGTRNVLFSQTNQVLVARQKSRQSHRNIRFLNLINHPCCKKQGFFLMFFYLGVPSFCTSLRSMKQSLNSVGHFATIFVPLRSTKDFRCNPSRKLQIYDFRFSNAMEFYDCLCEFCIFVN